MNMTATNFTQIRKIVHQRAIRATNSEAKRLGMIASDAMKICRDQPSLENARTFAQLESAYLNHPATPSTAKAYGGEVYTAIMCGSFTNAKPKLSKLGLGGNSADPEKGKIYIAQCAHRPNQLKIGYTTLSIKRRFAGYRAKYGEDLIEYWSIDCPYPARIESKIEKLLKPYRIAITKKGESNEWYNCTEQLALRAFFAAC